MVAALGPHHPYLRGAPPGLPFIFDERTITNGLHFTLVTDLGELAGRVKDLETIAELEKLSELSKR